MGKKNGFTLVELLATIIILGIIISIVGYVAINAINKSKEKSYKVTINEIEKDANNYLMENINRLFFLTNNDKGYEYQCVMVENLVDYGYLNNNIVKSNVSKNDTVSLNDYIYIERNKDTKSIEKVLYTKTNPEYINICGKAVNALGDIVFSSNPGFNEWSKYKDITITYKLKNLNDQRTLGNYIFNHSYSGTNEYDSKKDTLENNIKTKIVRVTSNGDMSANIKLKDEIIVSGTRKIDKIDTVGPVIALGNYTGSKTVRQTVTIPVKVTDVGSGVDHSSFTKDDIEVMIGNSKITDYSLTKVNNTDYNIKIDSNLYNGKVVLNIGKDKIFDNVHNGNLNGSIDTNIKFDNTYKITYNANGGSGAPGVQSYTYAASGTIALSSVKPTRTGYTFLGWSTNKSATTATYGAGAAYSKNIAKDVTLYAVWKINTYKITYNANGGSGAPGVQSYTYAASGTIALSSVKPTRTGYAFLGWSTNKSATTATYGAGAAYKRNNTNNITLYAVWKRNIYVLQEKNIIYHGLVYEVSFGSNQFINCRGATFTDCYGNSSNNDGSTYVRINADSITMPAAANSYKIKYVLIHTGIDVTNLKNIVVEYNDSYIDGNGGCLRVGMVLIDSQNGNRIAQSFESRGHIGESDAAVRYGSKVACPSSNTSVYSGAGSFSIDLSNLTGYYQLVIYLPGSSGNRNNYLNLTRIYAEYK